MFVLPDDDEPRVDAPSAASDQLIVARPVGAETRARRRALAGDVVQVLDEIGHARERARRELRLLARVRAWSNISHTTALSFGLAASMRAIAASTSSSAVACFERDKLRLADAVVTRKGVTRGSALLAASRRRRDQPRRPSP